MYSGAGTAALPAVSFLIRKSWDQWMVSSSPRLIAAAHVLHRLSVPRHPPCALVLLIRRTPVLDVAMEFSRSPRARRPPYERSPAEAGLSKLNSVRPPPEGGCRGRRCSRRAVTSDDLAAGHTNMPTGSSTNPAPIGASSDSLERR